MFEGLFEEIKPPKKQYFTAASSSANKFLFVCVPNLPDLTQLAHTILYFKCTNSWRFFQLHVRSVQCACGCEQRAMRRQDDRIPLTAYFFGGMSIDGTGHRPSIMARRSSPLLLPLAGWSPVSVNSPMILANSALACWSFNTELSL